ncbi:aspartate--tRNA ligase [Candidatus Azobacteroides pseudotrichonymphae]|jgi:aspartyl-tRNA synthetase|uniref:Aspartate--tRNA ligase n=1 Tax=Azobacteroides pseudotrichonymphae genomovar. CFP2 TaxID=511995 RepID=SYD_AZOPC|nr:aspartate--tRNA ligase [Candidatus Azobacteroides pseudotrichonymphae]B6YS49.1 RecName: Full=Aspartate--tRNA ligase; AltName: Full=Aspartyl-tRNA synthetase; Short=AspRS [Candidatus Azobacteroides pseudotrichonymphae genomovar. CFP2]MDR0530028.1 aspartate--tRNA ligase [Bacteroidales bacterium OttesenSCG-928-I14]BAG84021.1 aspartyl-tRNA synthetase [Candidatus Azobacteroides pseudotrichonymphae genomovar. CFP2]
MYRTNTCGELRIVNENQEVILCGWVQKSRRMSGIVFVDLRDRYGITQLIFNKKVNLALYNKALELGREWVIQIEGKVVKRFNKNSDIPTGDIEIIVSRLRTLNPSEVPPFTIEENTDGGDDLRMKYRYLDLRRTLIRSNLELRHQMVFAIRNYLNSHEFMEVETPVLINSTPEGARDFIVPSRMNMGEFYSLPQSPQLFKQLLMIAGFDRYFQVVKCFRDEDLRTDRQPEFTQVDCEMSFVEQEDILSIFEGLTKHLFKTIKGLDISGFSRLSYADAIRFYGSDKPDIRFGMQLVEIKDITIGRGFDVFDESEYVGAICAEGCAFYTRKQLDELTDFVKHPQIGAAGLIYVRYSFDGSLKSSVDKFYSTVDLQKWIDRVGAKQGDLVLILYGEKRETQKQLSRLRLEMGSRLGLRDKKQFGCLWVIDFPLFEYDNVLNRFFAKHHPFTSPKQEDVCLLETNPEFVRANAFDMVINGIEIGGGSIRIHNYELQKKIFALLGFSESYTQSQFGFFVDAFKYGAPPHGGIALGLDRFVATFAGLDSIRDCIAFPKNNSGRDTMVGAPSIISRERLSELNLIVEGWQ